MIRSFMSYMHKYKIGDKFKTKARPNVILIIVGINGDQYLYDMPIANIKACPIDKTNLEDDLKRAWEHLNPLPKNYIRARRV